MSKTAESDKGCIMLLESPDSARKKIMSAVTDSDNEIKYDPENKPGISNLIVIYSSLEGIKVEDAVSKFRDVSYGEFKKCVADTVCTFLEGIQKKYNEIIKNGKIDKILDESNKKVQSIAETKIQEVFKKVGVGR